MRRNPTCRVLLACILVAALAAAAPAAAQQPADARTWYPAAIGDVFEFDTNMRGRFTNSITDTTRLDGRLWLRVETTGADGRTNAYLLLHDGARAYHGFGSAPPFLVADFSLPVGGSLTTDAGTLTLVAHHDTVAVLGASWRDVRQYRLSTPAGSTDTYFARGIGMVAIIGSGPQGPQSVASRLVRARVGGVEHVAKEAAPRTSGVGRVALAGDAVDRLALLGRVWGFVKYHHPTVTGGGVDWDAELFGVLPAVLAATDLAAAGAVIDGWLSGLGEPPACAPCATPRGDLHLAADTAWLYDGDVPGRALRERLVRIHRNRSTAPAQRYVAMAPGAGNPVFAAEERYSDVTEPDVGFRLLALFRYWNIIRYWFPYRDLIDDDWDAVLREFIPVLVDADTPSEYRLAMVRLAGRTQDTHSTTPSAHVLRPPAGPAQVPVLLRFVEGAAVVRGHSHDELGPATGLRPGDAIVRIDGAPVDSLLAAWAPWYPASNEPARLRALSATLTRGAAGPVALTIRRGDTLLELVAERVPVGGLDLSRGTHDLPGPAFRMLDDEVAYLKLSAVRLDSLPAWMERAAASAVLVVDIRNYPAQFVPFALGQRFVERRTPFATFTIGDPANPGAFAFREGQWLEPAAPRYDGRVVVLVDETSISQSEYTAMALRAGPRTIVVGSTTAGADGNVSAVPLPGGFETFITGIGVFHPDRSPTQRIGIIPDVEVRPTIAGIREGRDEVMEAGVSAALGRAWRLPR